MGRLSKIAIIALAASSAAHGATYTANVLYPMVGQTGIEYAAPSGGVQSIAAGQATGLGYGTQTTANGDPVIWSSPSGTLIDLNPKNLTGLMTATVSSTDGAGQVGYASLSGSSNFHALLWTGTGASAVDLNPSGFVSSFANGVSGTQDVGQASKTTSGNSHAIAWAGTATSAVDLNPSGYASSVAYGTDGINQVGKIEGVPTGNQSHASVWSGNASSVVDLNPTNFGVTFSLAYGVAGAEQVGYGGLAGTSSSSVALLWEGSAKTAVNLNPAGSIISVAYGTNGTQQVGFAQPSSGNPSATAWSGSTDSTQNLQTLLPSSGTWSSSNAYTVDSSGNIYGTAFGTYNNVSGNFAVEWSPAAGSRSVTVGSGQSYHFVSSAGTGIVNTVAAGLTVASGGSVVVDPAAIHSNRQLLTVLGGGLALAGNSGSWTGQLDLANNDLDLPGASLSTVTKQIAEGSAFGRWNGVGGIVSSAAANDTSHLTALGVVLNDQTGATLYSAANLFDNVAPAPYDVLVKYTWYGDANLDGRVDGSDFSLIDAGYNSNQPGFKGTILTGWYNGDFNYDGVIDGSDYSLIDNAFNNQGSNRSQAAMSASALALAGDPASAVPEPFGMTCLLGAGSLLSRNRRARRTFAR